MQVRTILALDLATKFGWARGNALGVLASGSRTLPKTGDDLGAYFRAFRGWLTSELTRNRADMVVYESPILPQGMSIASRRKLYGLCGMTEVVAGDMGAVCFEAHLQQIRSHFIGRTGAPKTIENTDERRKWLKYTIIEECKKRGWKPQDDNEADALALLDFARTSTMDQELSVFKRRRAGEIAA